jgi:predicted TIM-barrel fold metal-dependent hydrolase
VHFWDLSREGLPYGWLQPGTGHPVIGNIESIKAPLFDGYAFHAESRFTGVERIVHVEAAAGAAHPDVESAFVREAAAAAGLPCALVVSLDLSSPVAVQTLAALGQQADVRGVRDFGVVEYLDRADGAPEFHAALEAMGRADLLLDLDCDYQHMAKAREMAERHPELNVVLEHIGFPRARDDAYFSSWSSAIRHLAGAPNVSCKLSGLGMTDREWTVASLRRWVDTCLEAFLPPRCLYGSNWPVDRIASSYDAVVAAFGELIGGLSESERHAIWFANAERLYFSHDV